MHRDYKDGDASMFDQIHYGDSFLPPDTEYFLCRLRIDILIMEAIRKPLTTVIAGAGFGKTQAVSAALESTDENILWLQLSELDNLIPRLWERINIAFKKYNPNLSDGLMSLGYPDSLNTYDQCFRLLAKELSHIKRYILVLDDFYFIHDQRILNFLEKLIYARIPNLSIILISRTKPNLNLVGMLSKGLLTRITEDDLRFSKEEMNAYYLQQGLRLSEEMSSNIYSYTNGWIVAIYLVGLSIKTGNFNEQNPISLAKIDIYKLIENEVFSAASKKLQDFLVKISILDDAPKGLLLELGNHDDILVSEATKISIFIRFNPVSESYRIHHLFRDFLLERKNNLTDEEITQIHITAAKWYHKNNYKLAAIKHYKQCNCYNEIFDIILSLKRRVSQTVADSLIELIEQAPANLLEKRPIMYVVKSLYLINNNEINEAYEVLSFLRKNYEALPVSKENQALLGETYFSLGLISIINQNLEFEELFKLADKYLPNGSTLVDHSLDIAEGINITGIKNPVPGELKNYVDAMFRAMPYASRVMNGCGYGAEYLNAADACYMTGDIKGAEKNAYEAVFRAKQKHQYGIECMANFYLVRINVFKGDYEKTTSILKQMKTQLDKLNISDALSKYDVMEGWFYVKIGETDKVSKWILHEDETRKMLAPLIIGREYLVRSDCLLAESRYYELLAFMEQQDEVYAERGILYAIIQNKITRAIIHHYLDSPEDSITALNEAYALSSPNDLIIQYIEYGNSMRTVIDAASQNENCIIPKEWLDSIYKKSSAYAKQVAKIVSAYTTAHLLKSDNLN